MKIIKCDLCKKRIKEHPITIITWPYQLIELCEKCSVPILRFLKKRKFIKTKSKKSSNVRS